MENDDGRVRRKDTTKSRALTHFGIKTAEDKTFIEDGIAIWLYCKQTAVVYNGNASNLYSHFHTQHPAKYETVIKAKRKPKEWERPMEHNRILGLKIQSMNHLLK